jgi:hypothetical protein
METELSVPEKREEKVTLLCGEENMRSPSGMLYCSWDQIHPAWTEGLKRRVKEIGAELPLRGRESVKIRLEVAG